MIVLIDNYDSFSYNVYQTVGEFEPDLRVVRNDEKTIEQIETMRPDAIILSPGPGKPEDAGICTEVVQHFEGRIPILGICLGHQVICTAYGGTVTHASRMMHGKQSEIKVDTESRIFARMPEKFLVARYHSLALKEGTLPDVLKITARSEDQEIMAVEHRKYPIYGLQFHPESVLTPEGKKMIQNFVEGYRHD